MDDAQWWRGLSLVDGGRLVMETVGDGRRCYHIMDPNIDLDEVLDQMINEELEDNTDDKIIRLILKSPLQLHGNTTRHRQRRRVVHRNCEEDALSNHDDYFQMKVNALQQKGLSPLQKCTTALRILAYGSLADGVDEYVRIGETTIVECLERFVSGICTIFGNKYLRRPNNEDIERLLQIGVARGFSGILGSIDCMHWE
ncbi:hypothetical protein GmHk_12G035483 [Glycine max]|nr:hypothetical protein GmHk_12G035483 [Glycine max]